MARGPTLANNMAGIGSMAGNIAGDMASMGGGMVGGVAGMAGGNVDGGMGSQGAAGGELFACSYLVRLARYGHNR